MRHKRKTEMALDRKNASAYAEITESRHQVVFPFLCQRLRSLEANKILDFGGGDGRFLAEYLAGNFGYLAYYDISTEMRFIAEKRFTYLHEQIDIIHDLNRVQRNTFDAVTMIAVWMELENEVACARELNHISKFLSKSGTLMIVVTHPCFRQFKFRTHKTDFDVKKYFDNGEKFRVCVSGYTDQFSVTINDTHWNIEALTRQLCNGGFCVTRIFELPESMTEAEQALGSLWMIVEAKKLSEAIF